MNNCRRQILTGGDKREVRVHSCAELEFIRPDRRSDNMRTCHHKIRSYKETDPGRLAIRQGGVPKQPDN
jgi:hypothetical protein